MATSTLRPVPSYARRSATRLAILVLVASLGTVASACDDDSTSPDEKTVVGTWDVTSFVTLGTDYISEGMSLAVTITDSGSLTFSVQNDELGICDPGPDCTDSNSYVADGSTLTLDPGTEDETSFAYSIQKDKMVWTGAIDEIPVTISMTRR